MTSITSWTRIEPRARTGEKTTGIDARMFDPLWALARQWQLGEFQAEDTGTPVISRIRGTQALLDWRLLGPIPVNDPPEGSRYDPLRSPLEVSVENRKASGSHKGHPDKLPWAVEAGAQFLAMLEAEPLSSDYRAKFVEKFAFELPGEELDDAAAAFVQALAGRALDARRLARTLRSSSASALAADASLGITTGDRAEVRQTAQDWLSWYDSFFSEPEGKDDDAWVTSRLEYAVSVAARLSDDASHGVTLTAAEYADGHLGWSDFDVDPAANIGGPVSSRAASFMSTSIPAPVSIPGTPATRFWEIEDYAVANNLVSTGPSDLGQLLMIEYGSIYGNDWFVVPLDVPVGSLTRIDSMVVTDTFGVKTLLRPVGTQEPRPDWAMWQLDTLRRAGGERPSLPHANLFFLPPSVGTVLDGQPLEQVRFLRDEMANMAWAIEHSIEGPMERARAGASLAAPAEAPASATETPAASLPRYLLTSTVPENWIPLLPVQRFDDHGRIISRLVRGAMLEPDGSQAVHTARGQLLNPAGRLELFDEEVPREGIRVDRRCRVTRWIDGTTILWTAYRKHVGRGEGSSALRFDVLQE